MVPEFPHADKKTYIITRNVKPSIGETEFYFGSLTALVQQLKTQPGKHFFCDGGSQVVNELLKQQLIDELIISVIPIMLGEGIRLFDDGRPEQNLQLKGVKTYDTGLVQLHYACLNN